MSRFDSEKVAAALTVLGIDLTVEHDIASILIEPRDLTITRKGVVDGVMTTKVQQFTYGPPVGHFD